MIDLAEKNIDQQYSRYMKTPIGKISKLADDVSWELEKAGEKISKPFKAIGKALSDAYDEVDFQLWRLGKKIKGEW